MSSQGFNESYLKSLVGYLVKFIACGFLTPVVLMTFAAIVFAYITIAGTDMSFLRHLSFLFPIDSKGNADLDGNDIMRAYGLLTMAFFLLGMIVRGLVHFIKSRRKPALQSGINDRSVGGGVVSSWHRISVIKSRLIISSIVITVVWVVVFVSIPSARRGEETSILSLYVVWALFYLAAMMSNAIYIGIDSLANKILGGQH